MPSRARLFLPVALAAVASVAWCGEVFAQTNSLPPSSGSPGPQMVQGLPPPNSAPTPAPGESGDELTEINKQLVNPVSTIWSLIFQQNNYGITLPEGQVGHQNNLLFQPVLPVALTNDWNLINRPVFPLFNSVPTVNVQGNLRRTTGFGDMSLVELLSPSTNMVGENWLLGAGPTFIFRPRATRTSARESGRSVPPPHSVTLATNSSWGCSRSNGGRLAVTAPRIPTSSTFNTSPYICLGTDGALNRHRMSWSTGTPPAAKR